MQHWLVKQEPETYPWSQFVADQRTDWTGVRNFQARNFLRAMQAGDKVLYYHSGKEKAVVGIATVSRAAFSDPTAEPDDSDWCAVELRPDHPLPAALPLTAIRSDPKLKNLLLVRQSRLSVLPVTREEYEHIVRAAAHAHRA